METTPAACANIILDYRSPDSSSSEEDSSSSSSSSEESTYVPIDLPIGTVQSGVTGGVPSGVTGGLEPRNNEPSTNGTGIGSK